MTPESKNPSNKANHAVRARVLNEFAALQPCDAALPPVEYPHNPNHPIGTCSRCGEEIIYNSPRMGGAGGYIHKATGSFACSSCACSLCNVEKNPEFIHSDASMYKQSTYEPSVRYSQKSVIAVRQCLVNKVWDGITKADLATIACLATATDNQIMAIFAQLLTDSSPFSEGE